MNDRREQILARLVAIGEALAGIRAAQRNRESVTGRAGPMIVIQDGDEAVSLAAAPDARGTIKLAPALVEMTPEFLILVEANSGDVGTRVNGFRAAAIYAVLNDDALLSITGSNGEIRYEGCTTSNRRGEKIEGGLALNFAFRYPLKPEELI